MTTRPDLRPRTIGENLDAGFKLFTSNFRTLITIAAVIFIPVAIINGLISSTLGDFNLLDLATGEEDSFEEVFSAMGRFFFLTIVTGIISGFAGLVLQASAVKVIGDAYQGRSTPWRTGINIGFRKFFPVFITGLLIALIGIGALIALGILVAVAVAISDGLGIAVGFFGGIALLISIFTLAYVAVPALIVEDLSPSAAIGRSFRLASRRFWPTFWTAFLGSIIVGIIGGIVSSIIQFAAIGPTFITAATDGSDVSAGLITAVSSVSGAVVSIFSTPFLAAVGMAVYFDLRVRQEGFDLELLSREMTELDPGTDSPPTPGSDPFGLDTPE